MRAGSDKLQILSNLSTYRVAGARIRISPSVCTLPFKTEEYYKLNKLHGQSKARAAGNYHIAILQERSGQQLRASAVEKDYQLHRSDNCAIQSIP